MKILLTGSTGLLGREVLSQLIQEGHSVTVLVRSTILNPEKGIKTIELDLGSDWDPDVLDFDFDCVIHLAQSKEFRDFPRGSRDVFQVNVNSTHKLLELARKNGCKSFVYASSGGVYADSTGLITEDSPLGAPGVLGFYLGSKACAEIVCQSYSDLLRTIILRPFFIYGPGQNRQMLIPRIFDSVATGQPIELGNPDGMKFNPVHVSDAANLVVQAISLERSQVINVAGPTTLTLGALVRLIGKQLSREPVIKLSGERARNLSARNRVMSSLIGPRMISIYDRLTDVMP